MAWEDRTPFEAIKAQFGYTETDVIKIMRKALKSTSFKSWRRTSKQWGLAVSISKKEAKKSIVLGLPGKKPFQTIKFQSDSISNEYR